MNRRPKLIIGVLLMVLGLGISFCSVVVRQHGRYGVMPNKVITRRGMMNGFGFGGPGRRFNGNRNFTTTPGSIQVQPPNGGPIPMPNPNLKGGVNQ